MDHGCVAQPGLRGEKRQQTPANNAGRGVKSTWCVDILQDPPPTGQGASTSPWVTTKYTRSGGAFDKFDYALSLKTYAAFT